MMPGPGGRERGRGGVSEDKMWFQVRFAEASVPHIEAIAGHFSVPPQTPGRSDKTSRYIPERPGPPPPGPELGFLLSPGETATPGTPGFHSSVGGGWGGIRLNLQRLIWTPVPPETARKQSEN